MRLTDFVATVRADLSGFLIEQVKVADDYRRAEVFPADLSYDEWLRLLIIWARAEERARRRQR